MNKQMKRANKSNQGNSFVIVIATLSFLAVLTTALLVAVGVCYRMKAFDINSRDNFYYLEKAMDEIYKGVGEKTMEHLNEAYNSVTDVIVVYDTEKMAYVTMDNDDANKLLNDLFMEKIKGDADFNSSNISTTIDGFITKTLSDGSSNGISLASVGNVVYSTDNTSMTIQKIVLKRKAKYSTVNTYKSDNVNELSAPAEYVQSITTDLVISAPKFDVDFSSVDNDDLYDYVMIGDMGVEIEGVNTRSIINGNLYAANDFYNKEYNNDKDTNVSAYKSQNDLTDIRDDLPDSYDGVKQKSMYSGLYVSKSKVSIIADKIIVPGSIAAMDSAELSIVGSGKKDAYVTDSDVNNKRPDSVTNHKLAQVWADNIVLGGYSKKVGTSTANSGFKGADIELSADTFISDDLELNAIGSKYVLDGNYYGYSNATTDKRAYTKAYLKQVLNDPDDVVFTDGKYLKNGQKVSLPGQAHYNSSAIVVNGQHSELDLSKTDAIYIAGQAYVEMSKDTKKRANALRKTNENTDTNGNEVSYTDELDTSEKDSSETDDEYSASVSSDESNPYSFKDKSGDDYSDYHEDSIKFLANGKVKYDVKYEDVQKDEDGNIISSDRVNKRVEDYRTGESISVKSNQLAYIPPYNVEEIDGRCYVSWPQILKDDPYFKTVFDDLDKIPVVKTVVSGKTYYFYDFTRSNIDATEYITNYAKLFYSDQYDTTTNDNRTTGDLADLYDITDWKQFKIGSILIDDAKVKTDAAGNVVKNDKGNTVYDYSKELYTQGAISVKTDADDTLRVVGNSSKMAPLFRADKDLKLKSSPEYIKASDSDDDKASADDATPLLAMKVSDNLKERYKKMRVLLTDKNSLANAENLVTSSKETSITPINTYFDYSKLTQSFDTSFQKVNNQGELKNAEVGTDPDIDYEAKGSIILQSNYQIFESEKDVVVKDFDSDGIVMGVVICKGDVTFDNNVKEFHGLIVAGGKIKVVDQNIDFVANREVVKAVLEECSNSTEAKLQNFALLFKSYSDKIAAAAASETEILSSMKSVSSVEYEDVLGYNNWRKNVD